MADRLSKVTAEVLCELLAENAHVLVGGVAFAQQSLDRLNAAMAAPEVPASVREEDIDALRYRFADAKKRGGSVCLPHGLVEDARQGVRRAIEHYAFALRNAGHPCAVAGELEHYRKWLLDAVSTFEAAVRADEQAKRPQVSGEAVEWLRGFVWKLDRPCDDYWFRRQDAFARELLAAVEGT